MQAITFDDGPFAYTQSILDAINAAGMKVVRLE
jgi:peptidoglycan/xylan/chitin deacetylase (PgdA/CDA1 family)